jgi:hypothetical protein
MIVRRVRCRVAVKRSTTAGASTSIVAGAASLAKAAPALPSAPMVSTKYSTPGAATSAAGSAPRR